jgi:CRP/FNR family transcriptional regulator, cyclic AMP receptor protein
MTTPAATTAKSGMRTLRPGEVLFNEGDNAVSLYIIQKGQIRLFKPKGKGYIELAVLRAGEVIGEMAFFDDEGPGKRRSCSASAITSVEIIEISFLAFGKTMQSLNPWFKTIINTLVSRLKKTNGRIKELEDNQASVSYGGKNAGYEFMKSIEVMRVLGTLFLVFKAHGELKQQSHVLTRQTLDLYTQDMFHIMEAKVESILNVLVNLGWFEFMPDNDGLPNVLALKNIDVIRQIFVFYNSERRLQNDKKLKISDKAELLIGKMIEKAPSLPLIDIPNLKTIDDLPPKFTKYYNITPLLSEFKAQNVTITTDHVDDGKNVGLFGEVIMKDGQVLVETDFPKLQKLYPVIRFINSIKRLNAEKLPAGL